MDHCLKLPSSPPFEFRDSHSIPHVLKLATIAGGLLQFFFYETTYIYTLLVLLTVCLRVCAL